MIETIAILIPGLLRLFGYFWGEGEGVEGESEQVAAKFGERQFK